MNIKPLIDGEGRTLPTFSPPTPEGVVCDAGHEAGARALDDARMAVKPSKSGISLRSAPPIQRLPLPTAEDLDAHCEQMGEWPYVYGENPLVVSLNLPDRYRHEDSDAIRSQGGCA